MPVEPRAMRRASSPRVFPGDRGEQVGILLVALALGLTTLAPLVAVGSEIRHAVVFELDYHDLLRLLGLASTAGHLLVKSTILSAAVALGTLLIGVPLAVLLARSDLAGRRLLLLAHLFPLFLPPFLLALGWFDLLVAGGGGGFALARHILFSPVGLVLVLALAFTPVVTAVTVLALDGIDPSIEEAARIVARPGRVATRILIPLARPAIALGALIVFSLAVSELGTSMFLRVETYPTVLLARLGAIDYAPGEALRLAVPLLVLALGLLGAERALARRVSVPSLGPNLAVRPTLPLGRWRAPLSLLTAIVVAASLLPILGLALVAARGAPSELAGWLGGSLGNSIRSAVIASTMVLALAVVLGHALARARPHARVLDGLGVLGFVTPGALLGVGLITLWNRAATHFVYASAAIIVLGYTARYAAIGVRSMAISVAQSPPALEDAAAVSGASFWRRLRRIVVPLHIRGALTAWLLTFVFCLRDTDTSVLFYPPGGEPLTVRILTLEANGPPEVVAGLALVQIGVTAAVLLSGVTLARLLPGWR